MNLVEIGEKNRTFGRGNTYVLRGGVELGGRAFIEECGPALPHIMRSQRLRILLKGGALQDAGGGGSVMDLMSPASKAGGETRPSRSRDPLSVFLGAEEPKGKGSVLQFPLPQGDLPRSPPDYK